MFRDLNWDLHDCKVKTVLSPAPKLSFKESKIMWGRKDLVLTQSWATCLPVCMHTPALYLMMTVGPHLSHVLLIGQEIPWHKLGLELYAKFGYQCLNSMCSLVLG